MEKKKVNYVNICNKWLWKNSWLPQILNKQLSLVFWVENGYGLVWVGFLYCKSYTLKFMCHTNGLHWWRWTDLMPKVITCTPSPTSDSIHLFLSDLSAIQLIFLFSSCKVMQQLLTLIHFKTVWITYISAFWSQRCFLILGDFKFLRLLNLEHKLVFIKTRF